MACTETNLRLFQTNSLYFSVLGKYGKTFDTSTFRKFERGMTSLNDSTSTVTWATAASIYVLAFHVVLSLQVYRPEFFVHLLSLHACDMAHNFLLYCLTALQF